MCGRRWRDRWWRRRWWPTGSGLRRAASAAAVGRRQAGSRTGPTGPAAAPPQADAQVRRGAPPAGAHAAQEAPAATRGLRRPADAEQRC